MSHAASSVASMVGRTTKAVATGGASEAKRYVDNQTQKAQNAADDAAAQQAAAEAAAANAGPKDVDLRAQATNPTMADAAQQLGSDEGLSPLASRRRGYARSVVGL